MPEVLDHARLEALLRALDSKAIDCRQQIAAMRRLMDQACDSRTISLSQWRSLLEQVSLLQARCVDIQPDAWRRPPALPGIGEQP